MSVVAVLGRAALAITLVAGLGACTKTPVRTPGPSPVLDTPAPPDRLIVPSPLPQAVEPPPPASPPAPAPQQASRPAASNSKPPDRASTSTSPPPVPTPPDTAAPPPVLQTTSNVAELEQEARKMIASAERDLGRVVFASLSQEGQRDFRTARNFVTEAQRNLKIKNFVLARAQADIAATLASALVKR